MLDRIMSDLRERRLWPLAVVLLVAIVAVPFVLAKTPAQAPPPPTPVAAAGAPVRTSLPSVSVGTWPSHSALKAKAHNPFTPSKTAKSASATATAAVSSATNGGASQSSSGTHTSSSASAGATGSPATGGVPVSPVKIPSGRAKPAPIGLRPDQAYAVTLAATRADGGLDTTRSLERLSAVPRATQPLLVELGVLNGGRRVLFAVLPGTHVSGRGTCIPGSVDCEVLSLGLNQVETVWGSDATAATEFAVTGIGANTYPTSAAALTARTATSAQGRRLLAAANLTAPNSDFSYDANLGAIVDLRNLAGGN